MLIQLGKIPAKGHVDEDGDKYCDVCKEYIGDKPDPKMLLHLVNILHDAKMIIL